LVDIVNLMNNLLMNRDPGFFGVLIMIIYCRS